MKRLFLLLLLIPGIIPARAQLTDIWLDDGVILSNDQWHYEDFSIIATNHNTFLIITPETYFYRQIPPYRKPYFPRLYQDVVLNYYPYFYRGRIGWYVHGRRYNYFYNGTDDYVILNLAPVILDFWLDLRHMRHLDLRRWGFYNRPRPHDPYRYGRPPVRPHQAPTPPPDLNRRPIKRTPRRPPVTPPQIPPPQRLPEHGTESRPPQSGPSQRPSRTTQKQKPQNQGVRQTQRRSNNTSGQSGSTRQSGHGSTQRSGSTQHSRGVSRQH